MNVFCVLDVEFVARGRLLQYAAAGLADLNRAD